MEGRADHVAVIPDAVHVAPETLRLWARTAALRDKLMAVSDNLSHAGLPAEDFEAGGQRLHRDGPVARNKKNDLGGTLDPLPELLMRRVRDGALTMAQAIRDGCEVPGRLVGDCGRLEAGMRADFVELRDDNGVGRRVDLNVCLQEDTHGQTGGTSGRATPEMCSFETLENTPYRVALFAFSVPVDDDELRYAMEIREGACPTSIDECTLRGDRDRAPDGSLPFGTDNVEDMYCDGFPAE